MLICEIFRMPERGVKRSAAIGSLVGPRDRLCRMPLSLACRQNSRPCGQRQHVVQRVALFEWLIRHCIQDGMKQLVFGLGSRSKAVAKMPVIVSSEHFRIKFGPVCIALRCFLLPSEKA